MQVYLILVGDNNMLPQKKRKAWNKGLKNVQDKYWLGKKRSEETKKKIGMANKGNPGCCKNKKRLPFSESTLKKMSLSHTGSNHWNWKGGITPKNKKIRNSVEFSIWRELVFERDNWTCQKCLIMSGNGIKVDLNPHHILNFSQYPELRFNIDNGITLCRRCHYDFHKKYGMKNNTNEQLKEFLKHIYASLLESGKVK